MAGGSGAGKKSTQNSGRPRRKQALPPPSALRPPFLIRKKSSREAAPTKRKRAGTRRDLVECAQAGLRGIATHKNSQLLGRPSGYVGNRKRPPLPPPPPPPPDLNGSPLPPPTVPRPSRPHFQFKGERAERAEHLVSHARARPDLHLAYSIELLAVILTLSLVRGPI